MLIDLQLGFIILKDDIGTSGCKLRRYRGIKADQDHIGWCADYIIGMCHIQYLSGYDLIY